MSTWLPCGKVYKVAHAHDCRKATLQQKRQWDLSNLQFVMSGAEPIRVQSMDAFFGAFKQCGLDSSVFCSAYGLAEHVCGVCPTLKSPTPKS